MITLDTPIFRLLNDVLGRSRIVVEGAYFLADYAPAVVISVLAAYYFLETRRRDDVRLSLLVAFLAVWLAWTASTLLADALFRPRPFAVLHDAHLLISSDRYSSFPNVTTAWCAAVAATMLRTPNKLVSGFFVGTAILFGVSRPILGDHWPSDILASFVVGVMASQLAFKVAHLLSPLTTRLVQAMNAFDNRWLD